MWRRLSLVLALVVLAAGCGGGAGGPSTTTPSTTTSATTTTVASTTTRATTTSVASTTTTAATTTTAPGALAAEGMVAPTEVLDGFRFSAIALEDEGEYGFVTEGTFVAPDAVECTTSLPHFWGSPVLGTLTAIGAEAWWSDDMGTNSHDRDDEFVTEGLADCPGAPEFWELPLMSEGLLAFGTREPGEAISGFTTTVITLTSLDAEVVLEEALLWVTAEGWPIKMEVHGTAPGGIGRVLGWENEYPEGDLAFTLGFELTDINAGSLMVRSPDGSATAGPLGGVAASIPDLAVASAELRAALDFAGRQQCMDANIPLNLLEPFGTEARLGEFSVAGVIDIGGYQATQLNPGSFVITDPEDKVMTAAEGDLARAHAILVFTHLAPLVAFFQVVSPSPLPVDENGRLDLAVWSGAGGWSAPDAGTPRVATWDGEVIEFAEFPDEPTDPSDLLHGTFRVTPMTDAVLAEAWARVEEWAPLALEAALLVTEGDPQGVADMQAVSGQLDEMNALGCALLGHVSTVADDFEGSGGGGHDRAVEVAAEEGRAQSLLLFLDYLEVMIHYLELPEVDWLQAEGVSLEDTMFTDDSAAEYLGVIARAAQDAVAMMGFFAP